MANCQNIMYRLYDYLPSGNGYKVRLTLKYLDLPYELIETDILNGASRTPEFLKKNPNGRIPLLEVPDKGFLAESHAIISYLAEESDLIPDGRFDRALMWHWLCFEQYHIEPNIGTARFWVTMLKKGEQEQGEKLIEKRSNALAALKLLDDALAGKQFMVGDRYSLADISLYAYTHVAPEAGLDLGQFGNIRDWCSRIEQQPKYARITAR
jgi:glutathione S-transferase